MGTLGVSPMEDIPALATSPLTQACLAERWTSFLQEVGGEVEAKEGERDGCVGRCPSWYAGSRVVSPRTSALWVMLVISKVRSLVYWRIYIFKCKFALDKNL